jgi:hypothetical protein
MEQMRDAFTEWAADAEKRPSISRPLKWQRLSKHYPDYQIIKRLTLTVMPVEGARPVRDKAAVTVALVLASRGGRSCLERILPGVLGQGADDVVVVDCGDVDGDSDWLAARYPGVRVVRPVGELDCGAARARNLGAAACQADWLCFVDDGVQVQPDWLDWLRTRLTDARAWFRAALSSGEHEPDAWGSCCISRSAFEQFGGYDTALPGWGREHADLYDRLELADFSERRFPAHFLTAPRPGDVAGVAVAEVAGEALVALAEQHYLAMKRGLQRLGLVLPEPARRQLMAQAIAQAQGFAAEPGRMPRLAVGFDSSDVITTSPHGRCRIRQNLQITVEPEAARPGPAGPAPRARKRSVMFHVGRSGSGVLGDMLNQHPDLLWENELYEKMLTAYERHYGPFDVGDPRCPIDPLLAVRQCLARTDDNLYGLEVKFFHLKHCRIALAGYIDWLERFGFDGWIVLKRRNLLRVVTSAAIGGQLGAYHAREGGASYPKTRLRLDPGRVYIDRQPRTLLQCLDEYSANFRQLDALLAGRGCLQLVYEDDIEQDPSVAYRKIADYLGLPPAETPAVRLRKTNPYPLAEMIENLDEVRACLRGTAYAWMTEA